MEPLVDNGAPDRSFHVVSKSATRKDAVGVVTGSQRYSVDVTLPRMLHGRIRGSPHAHARIKSIDTSKAEAMGAVCITFADVPQTRFNERIITAPSVLHKDNHVLADKVRRIGEAVAAVAAETELLAEQAVRAIDVEYEVLPAVVGPFEAMAPGSELVHDTIDWGDAEIAVENNVACTRDIDEGDAGTAFDDADVVVEGVFSTPKIHHMQLEPKTAICRPEPDGGLTVWATTQSIHNVRILLGQIFDIPLSKIDVRRIPIGGTFGSSIQMNPPIPISVALALKAWRPVKLALTREEDLNNHTKYASDIQLTLAATNDGTLTGADMVLTADIGAHNIQAFSYLGVCIGWMMSLYKIPNVRYRGTAVYTNKAPSCAMRGFGSPQVTFAVESLMDELAERLGIDPIELRLRNYIGMGETFWGQGPMVRTVVESDGVPELLARGAEKIGWNDRPAPGSQSGRRRRGIGMARGFHTSSAGAPQPGDVIDFSGAMVKINEDGSVDVASAVVDHGGGTHDAIATLVAEALCMPVARVNVAPGGTRSTIYDVATHASRGVYAGGGSALRAAVKVKQELLETAARFMSVEAETLSLDRDDETGEALISVDGYPNARMTIAEVVRRSWAESSKTIAAVESYRPLTGPPAYVAVFVEVEVDTWTGAVRTMRAVSGADSGTIINPDLASGQLEGGLLQGAGFALHEDAQWDRHGRLHSDGFMTDAKIPGVLEGASIGETDTFFADTYEPNGPFGAKGIGEAATNPVAAAYASAVHNALGVRFYDLPITPEKVLEALAASRNSAETRPS